MNQYKKFERILNCAKCGDQDKLLIVLQYNFDQDNYIGTSFFDEV